MLKIRDNLSIEKSNGVSMVEQNGLLSTSDAKELEFWKSNPLESAQGAFFDNIVHKSYFIQIFDQLIPRFGLCGEETILELGGGHCWASALLKRRYPSSYIVASDLSPEAVRLVHRYESILDICIDEKWSFNCRQIPFRDDSFDRIFTFAAFHHFGLNNDFSLVLSEMFRVLKPNGTIMLFYEPSTPRYLYRLARARVNQKREFNDEDVLVVSKVRKICQQYGVELSFEYFPYYRLRTGLLETLYYFGLTLIPVLQRCLPCTVNLFIKKTIA